MPKKLNIFVLNNSLTTLMAEHIVLNNLLGNDCCAVVIGENLILNETVWDHIIYTKINITRKYGMYWLADLYRAKKYARLIRGVLVNYDIVEVLVPNINNVLTNNLSFNRELFGEKKTELSLIAEGMLYCVSREKYAKDYLKDTIRYICSHLVGLKYHLNEWPETGINLPFVKSVYCFSDLKLNSKANVVQLDVFSNTNQHYEAHEDTCIIIGSYLHTMLKHDQFTKIASGFSSYIKQFGFSRVYYKPHPRTINEFDPLIDYFHCAEIVKSAAPIELICADYKPKYVFAFYSTALETLKVKFADDIVCCAYGIDFMSENYDQSYSALKQRFLGCGVTCIDYYNTVTNNA